MSNGYLSAAMFEQRRQLEVQERQRRISEAWTYYEGRHPQTLTVRRGQPDDNTVINIARQIVDKGVSLLFGQPIEMQIAETDDETETPTDDSDTDPLEDWIESIWKKNKQQTFLHDVAVNGSLGGIAAIKIKPRPDGSVKLINLNPADLDILTDEEDIDEVLRYRIQYTVDRGGAEVTRRQDITKQDNETWLIEDFEAVGANVDLSFRLIESTVWPYPLPPVLHCKNLPCPNSVWGYTDLEDVKLNDAINLVVSSARKVLRLHGFPTTIGKGVTNATLQRGPDQFWMIPAEAEISNLEMKSDLTAAREFYLQLRAAFYAQGRLPDMSQVGDLGALTNFGLRILFADALERTVTKRALYGDLINQVNKVLALIGGFTPAETVIEWPDPLPINPLETVQEITALQSTNLISDETLTQMLGRDYEDEQDRIDDEQQRKQQRMRSQQEAMNGGNPLDPSGADAQGAADNPPPGDQPDQANRADASSPRKN